LEQGNSIFVQKKSLGSCMAPPQGLKPLHSEMLKKSSSQEPLGQFQ